MTDAPITIRFGTAQANRQTQSLIRSIQALSRSLQGVASGPNEEQAERNIRRDLNRLSAGVLLGVEDVVIKTMVRGAEELGRRTPKLTGNAVSGWEPSIGTPNVVEQPVIIVPDDRGPAVKATAEFNERFKLGNTAFISNGVPYIGFLEDGRSQQAPDGFINQTIVAMLRFVNRNAAPLIERFLVRGRS